MTENEKENMEGTEEKGEKEKSSVGISPLEDETIVGKVHDKAENEIDINGDKDEELDNSKVDLDKSDSIITVEDNGDDIKKTTISDEEFYANVSEEEKKYYEEHAPDPDSVEDMNIHCTACNDQVNHHVRNNISRHPHLGVPICRKCKSFYEDEGEWEKDDQGSDCYCRWCANGGEMICCDNCPNSYCKRCITRNLGRKAFNQINDSDTWNCFLCDPKPIFQQRALMYSISIWSVQRKAKLKLKEKEKKEKRLQQQEKSKQKELSNTKPDNFIDENINEAFDTLRVYQKCLDDERKRWSNKKKVTTADSAALLVSKLKKVYNFTKQNMDFLEKTLLQGFIDQYPEESKSKFKNLVKSSQQVQSARITTGSPGTGPAPVKRKTKTQAHPNNSDSKKMKIAKTVIVEDDDDIAVEEIVVNGEQIMGNEEFFDPAALCSVQITGVSDGEKGQGKKKAAPPPPKIKTFKPSAPKMKPSGPLRISSKMFKKKSPVKKSVERAGTPDSDVVEILSDNDEPEAAVVAVEGPAGDDSDVSLE